MVVIELNELHSQLFVFLQRKKEKEKGPNRNCQNITVGSFEQNISSPLFPWQTYRISKYYCNSLSFSLETEGKVGGVFLPGSLLIFLRDSSTTVSPLSAKFIQLSSPHPCCFLSFFLEASWWIWGHFRSVTGCERSNRVNLMWECGLWNGQLFAKCCWLFMQLDISLFCVLFFVFHLFDTKVVVDFVNGFGVSIRF